MACALLENDFLCRYVMAKLLQDGAAGVLDLLVDVASKEMKEQLLAQLIDVGSVEGKQLLVRLLQDALNVPPPEHSAKRAKY
jgi:hypothetical protein